MKHKETTDTKETHQQTKLREGSNPMNEKDWNKKKQ